ncbi:trigger factor [Chloroflexota bacterium]
MKITNEKTENRQAFLTVEMEPDEVEASLEESYHRLAKKTNISGFRKGKAPRAVLERYIGKESLLEDALNSMLPEAYEKAIKEQKIEACAQPRIEIAQTDPVIFKLTVPLTPTIKLGDYHNIHVEPEPVDLSEDNVDAVLEQLRHQHATWEPVERPVDYNDLLSLDVDSNVEGEPFVNQKGAQYQVLRELALPAPGFAEQLIGLKKDEEKEFKLQLPSDYSRSEIAGKESSFKVMVTEIKQEKLPELNNKFAKEVGPDFKSLQSLRKRISADLKLRAEEQAKLAFEERVIEAVVDITELEFPPILVEMEIDWLIDQQLRRWQMGSKGLEEYLSSINKTEEELRQELHPLATKRVSQSLTLGKIAEEEKFEVSDSEISAEIEIMAKDAGEDRRDELTKYLSTPETRKSIEQVLITRKTVQQLVETAKGSDINIKPKQKEEQK